MSGSQRNRPQLQLDGLALSLVLAVTSACSPQDALDSDFVLIRHVTVISATGAPALADASVLIQGRWIEAVGADAEVERPRSARVIDATGKYLIPGLWEMHAHLSKTRASAMGLFVANGVTSLRDMGGDHQELLGWRREVRAGERTGPRILLAGPYLESGDNVDRMRATPPAEMIEPVERTRIPVRTPEDAYRLVDSIANTEVDFLKIRTLQSLAAYQAIADAAQRVGLPLMGHVFGLTPEQILDAGQGDIEHDLYPPLDDRSSEERMAVFRRFAEAGVVVVPTLIVYNESIFASPEHVERVLDDSLGLVEPRRRFVSRYLLEDWREQALERAGGVPQVFRDLHGSTLRNLREMHAAGVSIMPGSDVAVLLIFPGSTLHDEMALFVTELGMTAAEVIERATRHPAELMGLADSLGTIEPGKIADLVLLTDDPLADIRNVGRIESVILGGRVLTRADLDTLLASVEAAEDRRINDWPREAPSG